MKRIKLLAVIGVLILGVLLIEIFLQTIVGKY